jgi:hypothetical protein
VERYFAFLKTRMPPIAYRFLRVFFFASGRVHLREKWSGELRGEERGFAESALTSVGADLARHIEKLKRKHEAGSHRDAAGEPVMLGGGATRRVAAEVMREVLVLADIGGEGIPATEPWEPPRVRVDEELARVLVEHLRMFFGRKG